MNLDALPFVEFSNRELLPSLTAVYFAINSQSEVLYVGKSVSLNSRWRYHHRLKILSELGCTKIAWIVSTRLNYSSLELEMISLFNPPVNGKILTKTGLTQRTDCRLTRVINKEVVDIFSKFYGVNHDRYRQDLEWSDLKGNV